MNFKNLIMSVNTMFETKSNVLFKTINATSSKIISDSYYLATGINLSEDTMFFTTTVNDTNNVYKVVLGKSSNNKTINDILFTINNEMVILCVIPEDLIEGKYLKVDAVDILFEMYKFIVNNVCPFISANSIYIKALNVMPAYLTFNTISTWFKGYRYQDFYKILNEETYNKLLDLDQDYLLNYSYIYALKN